MLQLKNIQPNKQKKPQKQTAKNPNNKTQTNPTPLLIY